MISYPGEILARFGRYEAVERLRAQGRAEMWKAWDPYLERFVRLAVLPALTQAELHSAGGDAIGLLARWLGSSEPDQRRVLDFAPPEPGGAGFFVLEAAETPSAASIVPTPPPASDSPVKVPPTNQSLVRRRGFILGCIASFAVGMVLGAALIPRQHEIQVATIATPSPAELADAAVATSAAVPSVRASVTAAQVPSPTVISPNAKPMETAPLVLTRLDPAPGAVKIQTGQSKRFSAEVNRPKGVTFLWRLDGRDVGRKKAFQLRTAFTDQEGSHSLKLAVADPRSGSEVDESWSVVTEARNSPPRVEITGADREFAIGEVLVLTAAVKDPDIVRGDHVACDWTVDGALQGRHVCRRFEWRVPADVAPGEHTVSLSARDSAGLTVNRSVQVVVKAAPPLPTQTAPESTAVPTPAAPLPQATEPDGKRIQPEETPAAVHTPEVTTLPAPTTSVRSPDAPVGEAVE